MDYYLSVFISAIGAIAVFEFLLMRVNYKARAVYGMYEHTALWRFFDIRPGVIRYLPYLLHPLSIAGFIVVFVFYTPMVFAAWGLGMLVGIEAINWHIDSITLKNAEKCFKCPSIVDCYSTLIPSNCKLPQRLNRVKILQRLGDKGIVPSASAEGKSRL